MTVHYFPRHSAQYYITLQYGTVRYGSLSSLSLPVGKECCDCTCLLAASESNGEERRVGESDATNRSACGTREEGSREICIFAYQNRHKKMRRKQSQTAASSPTASGIFSDDAGVSAPTTGGSMSGFVSGGSLGGGMSTYPSMSQSTSTSIGLGGSGRSFPNPGVQSTHISEADARSRDAKANRKGGFKDWKRRSGREF